MNWMEPRWCIYTSAFLQCGLSANKLAGKFSSGCKCCSFCLRNDLALKLVVKNSPSPSLLSCCSTQLHPIKSNYLWSLCGVSFSLAQPSWSSRADLHWLCQGSSLLPPNNHPADQPCPLAMSSMSKLLCSHWSFPQMHQLRIWPIAVCKTQISTATNTKMHYFLSHCLVFFHANWQEVCIRSLIESSLLLFQLSALVVGGETKHCWSPNG